MPQLASDLEIGPADRNQIGQSIKIDRQRRTAVLAAVAMHLVGAVEGLQVTALGPLEARTWENRQRHERCPLKPAADRAVTVVGVDRGLGDFELILPAKTRP